MEPFIHLTFGMGVALLGAYTYRWGQEQRAAGNSTAAWWLVVVAVVLILSAQVLLWRALH
ncbi:MAG: hypothetical protein K2X82_23620 [Gemmataceae bacterium]|nr:hypothetical protein [Gemmataceae bacterium]